MEQTYTLNLVDGTQHVWTADLDHVTDAVVGSVMFLQCAGGVLINLAHVVTMVPVG